MQVTEGVPTLSTPAEVPAEDFEKLLATGRERGSVSADDIVAVLERVELSHDLIDAVKQRVRDEGIAIEDEEVADEEEEEDDDDTAAATPSSPAASATAAPERLARPRTSPLDALQDAAAAGTGADPVRMYLKEIGKAVSYTHLTLPTKRIV